MNRSVENIIRPCQCQACQRACTFKPGMIEVGQVQYFHESMQVGGKTGLQLLLDEGFLQWDVIFSKDKNFGVVAYMFLLPGQKNSVKTEPYLMHSVGSPCTFFARGLCQLHATFHIKPMECVTFRHDNPRFYDDVMHIAETWFQYWQKNDTICGVKPPYPGQGWLKNRFKKNMRDYTQQHPNPQPAPKLPKIIKILPDPA